MMSGGPFGSKTRAPSQRCWAAKCRYAALEQACLRAGPGLRHLTALRRLCARFLPGLPFRATEGTAHPSTPSPAEAFDGGGAYCMVTSYSGLSGFEANVGLARTRELKELGC